MEKPEALVNIFLLKLTIKKIHFTEKISKKPSRSAYNER